MYQDVQAQHTDIVNKSQNKPSGDLTNAANNAAIRLSLERDLIRCIDNLESELRYNQYNMTSLSFENGRLVDIDINCANKSSCKRSLEKFKHDHI